jgi:hypothetical protein
METKPIQYAEYTETRQRPLWYHLRGLQQTASGYGARLVSSREVFYAGRWRRVYITQYGNAGSAWIIVKGARFYLRG